MDAIKRHLPILVIAASLGAMTCGLAQTPPSPSPNPAPPPGKPGERMRDRKERFLDNLDPAERERFLKARQQALQDPAIQELRKKADDANRELFKAVRDKMQEIDPGLAEIIKDQVKNHPEGGPGFGHGDGPGRGPGFANLSEAERDKLMAVREKAKADPAVQAAEQKKGAAQSPQERAAAGEEYRKAMRAAMLKADPSLAPLLDKLEAAKPPGPPPPPGGDNEMMEKK